MVEPDGLEGVVCFNQFDSGPTTFWSNLSDWTGTVIGQWSIQFGFKTVLFT